MKPPGGFIVPFQSGVSLDIQPQDVFHRLKAWRLYLVLLKKSGRLRQGSACFSWGSRPEAAEPPFGCTKNLREKKQDFCYLSTGVGLCLFWIIWNYDTMSCHHHLKVSYFFPSHWGRFLGGHHQNSHHPGCQDPDPLLHNGWGSYQTWVPWRRSSPATWWPPLPRCPYVTGDEAACWSTTGPRCITS